MRLQYLSLSRGLSHHGRHLGVVIVHLLLLLLLLLLFEGLLLLEKLLLMMHDQHILKAASIGGGHSCGLIDVWLPHDTIAHDIDGRVQSIGKAGRRTIQ